jgi:cyanophycinase-like exopeptidase
VVTSSGRLVIMGSGETAPTMVGTHRNAIEGADASEVLILDSPFGFQENVEQLTARLSEFFGTSLSVSVDVGSLRTRDPESLELERFRSKLATARVVFAGPGSPSYALAVWSASEVGPLLADVIARGGSVVLASAAALTAGVRTIPVYEIYKVGADPHWLTGLDLLAAFGIRAAVVPHWNNTEGANHDTSRCYIGERRLSVLERELDCGMVGVDEHTAATFDGGTGAMVVTGKGTVTLRGTDDTVLGPGDEIALDEVRRLLGSARSRHEETPNAQPDGSFADALASGDVDGVIAAMLSVESQINEDPSLRSELRSMIVRLGDVAGRGLVHPRTVVGGFIDLLLELRRDARAAQRFELSDRIRDGLAELGVEVRDTGQGPEWEIDDEGQKP